jgi:RNA polymerase sigma-70 factor (ECF subfamily)
MSRSSASTLSATTDAMLAQAIASMPAGDATDEEAELYRRFAPRVRLFGLRRLGEESAAQDLVQQVFVITLERLRRGEVRNPDAIGSFILGTSRTIAGAQRKIEHRRRGLHETFDDRTAFAMPQAEALDLPRVERCLETLAPRDRMILILTFYAEKPAADVGAELHLAPAAVRVARHRALARMRDCVMSEKSR